jgi:hypothetical protein
MCYYTDVPDGFSGSALDPIKGGTYSRVGKVPDCASDKENEAGLCYDRPRDGWSCTLTGCQKDCEDGLVNELFSLKF